MRKTDSFHGFVRIMQQSQDLNSDVWKLVFGHWKVRRPFKMICGKVRTTLLHLYHKNRYISKNLPALLP